MPVAYIDIRFFAHATEDLNRVVKAAETILPTDYLDNIVFKRRNLRGHYGNPITLFEARIKRREIIKAFIENLSTGLGGSDKETLLSEIGLHAEKGSLYIRLDKQAALQGEFKFCTADPIRVRIRFRKEKLEDIIEACREMGILP
ncbi:MAG: RNA-binding domain-containing protein [Candidatus Bathyarchaeia archaeon]